MSARRQDTVARGTASGGPDRRRRALFGGGALVVVVVGYFVLAATVPRWWAHRIGDAVGGSLATGLLLGLAFGILCTLLPLLVAWTGLRRRSSAKATAGWLALALLLALPNLWTLSVVVGNGSAAHAGQRTMDVEAPWFRGGTLVGAVTSVVVFAALVIRARRRRPTGKRTR
ncbi:hypothetical protein [Streptomyces sp. NPDC086023]|uniref:hypothetical protein n=1 Tax=Streptomyces sp. NPDC086023 TaxID=3365746 RepID=UPI0037CF9D34